MINLRKLSVILICLSITGLCSCVATHEASVKTDYFKVPPAKKISNELKLLKGNVTEKEDNYLRIAVISSHQSNPSPDYQVARDALQKYIEITPIEKQEPFVFHLDGLLSEILEMNGLVSQNRLLLKENKKLKKSNKALEKKNKTTMKQNKDLQDKISKLKFLDIRLEKKRIQTE